MFANPLGKAKGFLLHKMHKRINPCSSEVNPVCQPVSCKTSTSRSGKCTILEGKCVCVADYAQQHSEEGHQDSQHHGYGMPSTDPCSENLNPMCVPTTCTTASGLLGKCSQVGRKCICVVARDRKKGLSQKQPYNSQEQRPRSYDPCSDIINPMCKPTSCLLPSGVEGRCMLVNDRCVCGEFEHGGQQEQEEQHPQINQHNKRYDTCESQLNPRCSPVRCITILGRRGVCSLVNGLCRCIEK
ncbi:conserved hypothetical protein [Thermosulfidibacter takaii ABI70S6]|uniref:Uncharacterized protein n=1 Tax=Thermosulfidibacter takaii (strain DSM 17441 / JCM 13301 / NBRC 103674 / ABI70S6) TaxID=1298851 RepID=A0A0S3QV26_THET7|nr:conserved hypothetical protein [Thermosulfidibacter takaii ABI70S6]